jgi:hypothetical protein
MKNKVEEKTVLVLEKVRDIQNFFKQCQLNQATLKHIDISGIIIIETKQLYFQKKS